MGILQLGSSGADVELLQLALVRSGYYKGKIDGYFGAETQNVVRRFQSDNALAADGAVGEKTWAALRPFILGYFMLTVRAGDTLNRIAKRYDTSIEAIEAANHLKDPNALAIGEKLVVPYGFRLVPTDMRFAPKLTDIILDGLEARYPFLRSEVYGSSVLGSPLRAVSFGKGAKEMLINASHHANEWITTPLVLKFLESFLIAYINGGTVYGRSAKALYERVKVTVVPLVNPDGVALVNGAIDKESACYIEAKRIAARYPSVRFPEGWKANIAGTDLNLNYPADWEEAKQIKFAQGWTEPAPRDYVGTEPLSAPESRALYELTLSHDFALTISYHTQGREIYWRFKDMEPPKGREIGEEMAAVSGYELALVPDVSSNAGYKDWFILNYDKPGYTVEAGAGVNPLPLSQFDEMYNDNIGIMITAMEWI
ncbi:MAG: peptidoglycan-binding protein [Clostridia bacterium]|nr:peptidoglycan-binding protein [Clostridia bacterium]